MQFEFNFVFTSNVLISGTIKKMLEIQEDVPVKQQSLLGWPGHLQITDEVRQLLF